MAMGHIESREGLGQFANDPDRAKAGLARTLITAAQAWREAYGDIPFPSVLSPVETRPVAPTPEAPVEVKRFSEEQKEALRKEGYVVYGLTGQSIKTLREQGRRFWSTWHDSMPDFEALGSMHSEVAINPDKLFLPRSNNKTLAQQEEMVEKFKSDLVKKIPGFSAIIGQAPDYAELAFAHLDATKEYLFGAKYNYNYARTKTPTSSSFVANVGGFHADAGLHVSGWSRGHGDDGVHAAPLVVPV